MLLLGLLLPASTNRFAFCTQHHRTGAQYPKREKPSHGPPFSPSLQTGTTTNELGAFKIKDLEGDQYELSISFVGFMTQNVQANTSESLDIRLEPTVLDLTEFVVNNQRDLGKTMTLINKIDLELRPTRSSQDVLRMIPGLITAQHAGGGKAEQIYLRGFDIDHGTDIENNR